MEEVPKSPTCPSCKEEAVCSHPARSQNMPPIYLGHVDVLSHSQVVYGPPHVAHLLTIRPCCNLLLSQPIFNAPQKYIHRRR